MNSPTPTEFLYFPQLPVELREMIWDEALPTLDLQRFNAEIAPHPDSPESTKSEDLMLCLTPNDDFVQLTSGYVGLLGACRESRWAAMAKIKGYLPINYIARTADDAVAIRSAKVPYNPDGHLCISGLGPAFIAAAEGHGARGMKKLQKRHWPQPLSEGIQCVTFPEIRNLTITLTMPEDFESVHLFLLGWDDRVFGNMVQRMPKVETVALVDEGVLNERRHIDAEEFEGLHRPVRVVRHRGDDDSLDDDADGLSNLEVPWRRIYTDYINRLSLFNAVKQFRAGF